MKMSNWPNKYTQFIFTCGLWNIRNWYSNGYKHLMFELKIESINNERASEWSKRTLIFSIVQRFGVSNCEWLWYMYWAIIVFHFVVCLSFRPLQIDWLNWMKIQYENWTWNGENDDFKWFTIIIKIILSHGPMANGADILWSSFVSYLREMMITNNFFTIGFRATGNSGALTAFSLVKSP